MVGRMGVFETVYRAARLCPVWPSGPCAAHSRWIRLRCGCVVLRAAAVYQFNAILDFFSGAVVPRRSGYGPPDVCSPSTYTPNMC